MKYCWLMLCLYLYFSLRGQTKSEISKQSSDTTANNNNASECVTPEPLVGRLETGTVNKLSFKLKDTVTKETLVTSNIGKELEIVNASTRYFVYIQLRYIFL